MSESVSLLAAAAGFLVLFGLIGSGPTLALAPRLPARLVLAPVVGLALWGGVLTTAGWLMPGRVGAWVVLLPMALGSLGWALWQMRGRWRAPAAATLAPVGIMALALIAALAPGVRRGTLGPLSLGSSDAWGYLLPSTWLQTETFRSALAPDAARWDLVSFNGWVFTTLGDRPGLLSGNAATSALVGATPDQTHYALLAALFALVPAGIWVVARALGVGRLAAAVGALMGLSPAILTTVSDSRTANLAGLALAPVALLLVQRGAVHGRPRELILAGLLVGGLVSMFVEFMVPLVATLLLTGVVLMAVRVGGRRFSWGWLGGTGARLLVMALVAAAISPVAIERAVVWLRFIAASADFLGTFPTQSLSASNVGAWATGVLHLHELSGSASFSALTVAVVVLLPLVVGATILLGGARDGLTASLVIAPIVGALVVSLVAYERNNACQYCGLKGFSFALPFLGVGLALGLARLATLPRPPVGAAAAAVVAILTIAPLARADADLIRVWGDSNAVLGASAREVTDAVADLPQPAQVFLEGTDASPVGGWTWLEADYLASRAPGARVSFLTQGVALPLPGEQYYSPDYDYVLTTFGGVDSGRERVRDLGLYSLHRRAPVDVVIADTSWSVDTADSPRAVPWVGTPFSLRLSGDAAAAALTVSYTRALGDGAALRFSQAGSPLPATERRADDSEVTVCLDVPLAGVATVSVVPVPDRAAPATFRVDAVWPVGSPPRSIGVTAATAEPGPCPPPTSPVPASAASPAASP